MSGGGGGGGGAYVEGTFTITPGATFPYAVGAAGAGTPTQITDSLGRPLFICYAGAAGTAAGSGVGVGGAGGTFTLPGTYPSNCFGVTGQGGQNGIETSSAPGYVAYLGGTGGAAFSGYPTANEVASGQSNTSPGSGGSGGGTGAGGGSGIGLLIVQWLPGPSL